MLQDLGGSIFCHFLKNISNSSRIHLFLLLFFFFLQVSLRGSKIAANNLEKIKKNPVALLIVITVQFSIM